MPDLQIKYHVSTGHDGWEVIRTRARPWLDENGGIDVSIKAEVICRCSSSYHADGIAKALTASQADWTP